MYVQDQSFLQQRPVEFAFCGYRLALPSRHTLMRFATPNSPDHQPHRESGLIQSALALKHLGRTGTVIDIGANVGDSLAIIARYSDCPVLSIEGSDFFFSYLQKNAEDNFKDRATVLHAMVVKDETDPPSGLVHWGGTAKPQVGLDFTERSTAMPIRGLIQAAGAVALLKLDTDGHDAGLIEAAFAGDTVAPGFPIYFEMEFVGETEMRTRALATEALAFYARMVSLGYEAAFLWDDPGRFYGLVDLGDPTQMANAINYLCHLRHRPIYGFDVCLVHRDDPAFRNQLAFIVSHNLMAPLPQV